MNWLIVSDDLDIKNHDKVVKDMYNKKFDRVCYLFCEDAPLKESDLEDAYNSTLVNLPYKRIKKVTYELMEDKEYMNYVQVNVESKNEYYNWYITLFYTVRKYSDILKYIYF